MRTVFADTHYWIALANPKDEWHQRAGRAPNELQVTRFITTDEVLIEFLAFFASAGKFWRMKAVELTKTILADPNVSVLPQTRESFKNGLALYEERQDKQYSLTDCISMDTMLRQHLSEVLTHDKHFAQEGFVVLLDGSTE